MFFNREDIEWFKPVELRTKYGRRGHIKEPLGEYYQHIFKRSIYFIHAVDIPGTRSGFNLRVCGIFTS
jgi:hypothetical protein